MQQSSSSHAADSKHPLLECPLCLGEVPACGFSVLEPCRHLVCTECLRQYLREEISGSRVNIACPVCSWLLSPNEIRGVLQDERMMAKYEGFALRRALITEPDARWCPAPDCGYAVIASGCASCPKLHCERPGCNTDFCYHCKEAWHPGRSCDLTWAQRAAEAGLHDSSQPDSQNDGPKQCPRCKTFITKANDGSCDLVTCWLCDAKFCWQCLKEVTYLHFLSAPECTFKSRRRWTLRQRLLWQFLGAPVFIVITAALLVPVFIIAIPISVGRDLHSSYDRPGVGRLKRGVIVASGVLGSLFIAPLIAAIIVGIGVPVLLVYSCIVVPVSLLRSNAKDTTEASPTARPIAESAEKAEKTREQIEGGSTTSRAVDGPLKAESGGVQSPSKMSPSGSVSGSVYLDLPDSSARFRLPLRGSPARLHVLRRSHTESIVSADVVMHR
ncbi:E3 ubiquitin-protein ligase RNF19B-like [Haemaphysalis longicornis]